MHITSIHGIGLQATGLSDYSIIIAITMRRSPQARSATHAHVPWRLTYPAYPLHGVLGSLAAGMPSKPRYALVPTGNVLAKGGGE